MRKYFVMPLFLYSKPLRKTALRLASISVVCDGPCSANPRMHPLCLSIHALIGAHQTSAKPQLWEAREDTHISIIKKRKKEKEMGIAGPLYFSRKDIFQ
jgi:hypothetical protein